MTNHLKLALEEINQYYGYRCAKRSGVPLINHINEGIAILQAFNCSEKLQAAFALHPITQNEDLELFKWKHKHTTFVTLLAEEYAKTANSYLCRPETDHIKTVKDLKGYIGEGIHSDVAFLLYADKIQNRKDFNLYHLGTHNRSKQLTRYFNIWIDYLKERLS